MKFATAVPYQTLSNKPPFCENRLSDCHTFIVRRLILLSFIHQTNKTNCCISPTEPMEGERQTSELQSTVTTVQISVFLQLLMLTYKETHIKRQAF
jgi:hypothetical protein